MKDSSLHDSSNSSESLARANGWMVPGCWSPLVSISLPGVQLSCVFTCQPCQLVKPVNLLTLIKSPSPPQATLLNASTTELYDSQA